MASAAGESRFERIIWGAILLTSASLIFSTLVAQASVILLLLLWLARSLAERRFRFRRTPVDLPYLAFVAARLVSIAFSVDPRRSLRHLHTEIPFYALFFVLTSELRMKDPGRRRVMLLLPVACASLASVVGVWKCLVGGADRATSTTSGYYTLGMYLTATLAMTLALGRSREFFPRRWLWALAGGVTSAGILFTENRIHWGIMVLVFLVVGVWQERWLLGGFAAAAAAVALLSHTVGARLEGATDWSSLTSGRDVIWRGAFMIGGRRPLTGFGPGTFRQIFPLLHDALDPGVGSWHNDFLQVYMESGILGLACYLALLAALFGAGLRAWRAHRGEPGERRVVAALALALGTQVLGGLTGVFVEDPLASLLFQVLAAMLVLT